MKVTARRTAIDFAVCMRELADLHYPKAERIRVVLDNLSTHSAGAFYQAFPAEQARRLLRRIELHYVPKHASWLNMVEIEIGVLAGQCLRPSSLKGIALIAEARRLGEAAQWRPSPHRLELHNRKGPHQNGASLSEAHKPKTAARNRQNLCAKELEFIRRFLLHVLPSRFHRIRHYGLFAGAVRARNIERVRQWLAAPEASPAETDCDFEDRDKGPSPGAVAPVVATG